MPANLENVVEAILSLETTTIVSCPLYPREISGIGAGAEGALDAMGTQFTLAVPKRGVIISAMFYDLDFEGTQVNIYLFNRKVTAIADNAAWTLSDADAPSLVAKLAFAGPDTHSTTCYTFELNSIGKGYTAPDGLFWVQASCVGTPTIAVAPRFQLQIQSFDPTFKES